MLGVGRRLRSDAALMYIKDLANPGLVAEVRRRLNSIEVDFVTDVGMLEQLIEDSPYNLNPQTLSTERPDRVAAALAEGRVAVLLSGSPFALVVPATMYSQLHTGEETYLRWQYGTFLRYVRTLSFYLALLLPGSYLAIVLYHQEMVPTELLLAIAGNRERVPFPTVVEMLLMEFAFELVREAGLRIPGIIGSTIGIVGALILGQAAVQANIVSPILVILVAVTGLASFSIPSHSLAFAVRIYRFVYIFMGTMLGFYGITIVLFVQILLTVNLKSFGVPYLSPAGPRTHPGRDVVTRLPIFLDRRRPDYLNPQDDIRSQGDPRGWMKGGGGGGEGRG
jgi:spore germination protein KA